MQKNQNEAPPPLVAPPIAIEAPKEIKVAQKPTVAPTQAVVKVQVITELSQEVKDLWVNFDSDKVPQTIKKEKLGTYYGEVEDGQFWGVGIFSYNDGKVA